MVQPNKENVQCGHPSCAVIIARKNLKRHTNRFHPGRKVIEKSNFLSYSSDSLKNSLNVPVQEDDAIQTLQSYSGNLVFTKLGSIEPMETNQRTKDGTNTESTGGTIVMPLETFMDSIFSEMAKIHKILQVIQREKLCRRKSIKSEILVALNKMKDDISNIVIRNKIFNKERYFDCSNESLDNQFLGIRSIKKLLEVGQGDLICSEHNNVIYCNSCVSKSEYQKIGKFPYDLALGTDFYEEKRNLPLEFRNLLNTVKSHFKSQHHQSIIQHLKVLEEIKKNAQSKGEKLDQRLKKQDIKQKNEMVIPRKIKDRCGHPSCTSITENRLLKRHTHLIHPESEPSEIPQIMKDFSASMNNNINVPVQEEVPAIQSLESNSGTFASTKSVNIELMERNKISDFGTNTEPPEEKLSMPLRTLKDSIVSDTAKINKMMKIIIEEEYFVEECIELKICKAIKEMKDKITNIVIDQLIDTRETSVNNKINGILKSDFLPIRSLKKLLQIGKGHLICKEDDNLIYCKTCFSERNITYAGRFKFNFSLGTDFSRENLPKEFRNLVGTIKKHFRSKYHQQRIKELLYKSYKVDVNRKKNQKNLQQKTKDQNTQKKLVVRKSKEDFSKPMNNDPGKKVQEELTDEDKFKNKNGDLIRRFASFRVYDDSRIFLGKNSHLLCEHTTNYLLSHCIDLEMEEKHELMKEVAHQSMCVSFILELAKKLCREPRYCIAAFVNRIQNAEPEYQKKFTDELDDLINTVKQRAAGKVEVAIKETEKVERQQSLGPVGLDRLEVLETLSEVRQRATGKVEESIREKEEVKQQERLGSGGLDTLEILETLSEARQRATGKMEEAIIETEEVEGLGPGGLDPLEVLETLPKNLKACFESQNIMKLQETISNMNQIDADYHMRRCVDSGLWVAQGCDPTHK